MKRRIWTRDLSETVFGRWYSRLVVAIMFLVLAYQGLKGVVLKEALAITRSGGYVYVGDSARLLGAAYLSLVAACILHFFIHPKLRAWAERFWIGTCTVTFCVLFLIGLVGAIIRESA